MQDLADHIGIQLRKPATDDPLETRAAIWLFLQTGYVYVYPIDLLHQHLKLAHRRLTDLLEDRQWLAGWSDPQDVIDSIEQQLAEVEERMRDQGLPDQATLLEKIYETMPNPSTTTPRMKALARKLSR